MTITWLDICLGALGLFLVQRIFGKKPLGRLPPGPPKWPLLGNILDMPTSKEWLTFAKWGQKYGDISSVTVFGRPLIIVNSSKIAMDMLDKKSSKYSDRPIMPMGGELCGWNNSLALLPYGDRFREYRRYMHQLLGNKNSMEQFIPVEEREMHIFLQKVIEKPAELFTLIRRTAGAIILNIAYGYELQGDDDPLVDLVDRAVEQFSLSTTPGAWLVDVLPFLKHIPAWVPGAGFKRTAKEWKNTIDDMVETPYNLTKQKMAAGTAHSSFLSNLLEGGKLSNDDVHNIKWSAASLYAGGADTTVSAIYSLFLAMTLFPDVQKKAQAEIDAVVGNDRLPSFSDRTQLPYIEALVKEVLRWHVVAPLAIPHRVLEDDFHEGFFIPRGALVIPNVWAMMRDERVYPTPSQFNPDRFIPAVGKEAQQDPRTMSFGFGRRICPGLSLADASLWISSAMCLAVFDITKAVENGVEITPVVDATAGTISHPTPFQCSIKPRSLKAAALIQQDPAH